MRISLQPLNGIANYWFMYFFFSSRYYFVERILLECKKKFLKIVTGQVLFYEYQSTSLRVICEHVTGALYH